jgi:hypothetical protein
MMWVLILIVLSGECTIELDTQLLYPTQELCEAVGASSVPEDSSHDWRCEKVNYQL